MKSELKIIWLDEVRKNLPEGVDATRVENILRGFEGSGRYEPDDKKHQYQVGEVLVSVKAHGNYPLIYYVSKVEVPKPKPPRVKNGQDSAPRDTKQLIARITDAGYEVVKSTSNHYKVYDGKRLILTFSSSPTDHRSVNNTWAQFRRYERSKGEKK